MVLKVTGDHDRDLFLRANEPYVIKIQAAWRGHRAQKTYQEKKHFIVTQIPVIIRIQVIFFLWTSLDIMEILIIVFVFYLPP